LNNIPNQQLNFQLLKHTLQNKHHLFSFSNFSNWTCPAQFYNASDGCDCDCGAPDPDCALPNQPLYGCYSGASPMCIAGVCYYGMPPTDWTCLPNYYNASDGCDCNCGDIDPDCLTEASDISGCEDTQGCVAGVCVNLPTTVPSTWICESAYYNASDGCDCNCGAIDPDCVGNATVYGCPCSSLTCSRGFCVGECNGVRLTLAISSGTPRAIHQLLVSFLIMASYLLM